MSDDPIRSALREHVAANPAVFGEGPVTDCTPLARFGVLDSIAVLELVLFIESRFGIELSEKELDRRRLETIATVEALVRRKLAEKAGPDRGSAAP